MSAPQELEKPESAAAAYVLIFSGVVAALQIGKLPPALPEISQALGMTLTQSGFLLSFIQLAGMSLALAIGMSADSFGAKKSMLLGMLLLGLASAMGSTANSVAGLMFWRILEGLGFLCVVLPAPGLIRQHVHQAQLRKLLGYWGAYMPAGTALTLLLGPLWLPAWGWRSWWMLFAVLSWGMAIVLWRVVPTDAPATSAAIQWQQRLRETLSAPGPWWVTLCFGMYSGQWLAVVGFLPSIYTQAGLSGGTLGALTAFAAAVNMLGNMMSGRLLQKDIHPSALLVMGFTAMALGAFLAFSEFTLVMPWLRYAGVLLFSSCGGLVPGTLFYLAVRLAPQERNVSTTVGWMQQGSAAGQFAGPPLVALLATWVGGWQWTWMATSLCCVLGCVLAMLIARTLKQQTLLSAQ
jgi:CP family cyanate transporter-like MFS transporter